jgi:alpha-tubulin suppressor-like RCC1 family protein
MLGLTDNGQIIGWGKNSFGQTTIPALPKNATKWISMSAGINHALGLTDDGQIVGWGYNYDGQINPPKLN